MKLSEMDIIANGIRLHVYRTGIEKPPLVFAHGRSDNGLCFWSIARHFADQFEIVLYDSRNHGKSEAPEGKTTLLDRAEDLAGLVGTLALQQPAMVGHSLGAVTVALFAGLYPQTPSCIVLEDPPPFALMAARDEQAVAAQEMWRESAAASKQKSIQELVEMSREGSPTWPEAEREPWAQAKRQFSLNAFDEAPIDAELGEQIMSRITCPVLLITGNLEAGAIYPPATADQWVAGRPNARHVNIPGAGHNIRREQPDLFLAAVRTFLQAC